MKNSSYFTGLFISGLTFVLPPQAFPVTPREWLMALSLFQQPAYLLPVVEPD